MNVPVHRLYDDLATWWPLISPPEEYTEEAAFAAGVLASADRAVHEVLELGSGGGHNAVHLGEHFDMTLVDLSPAMLEVSRRLNPNCKHHRADMRDVRLGRDFDAVFLHDAIDYMLDERDLGEAIATAAAHCRPGGVVVLMPDASEETFEPTSGHGGVDGPDGRAARYLEWTWDPDPTDTWVQTSYSFVLREAGGSVHAIHELHRTGVFPRETWTRLIAAAGLQPTMIQEHSTEERPPRDVFIGHAASKA